MEVLSSAEMTYSWADKGFPSQTRLYRSRTRAALAARFGSLTKIQDWYCQGLIASSPQPAPDRGGRHRRGDPISDDLCGQVRAAPPRQRDTTGFGSLTGQLLELSLIHISEPTRQAEISYAVF